MFWIKKIIIGFAVAVILSLVLSIGSLFLAPLIAAEALQAVLELVRINATDKQLYTLMFLAIWLLATLYQNDAIQYLYDIAQDSTDEDD